MHEDDRFDRDFIRLILSDEISESRLDRSECARLGDFSRDGDDSVVDDDLFVLISLQHSVAGVSNSWVYR